MAAAKFNGSAFHGNSDLLGVNTGFPGQFLLDTML
jgi:hypothetical protein